MKILVVAQVECCPAVVALRSERFDFRLVLVKDEFTYGKALQEMWQEGETFINLEHDVVPWPGALHHLWNCSEPTWCGYQYPIGYSGVLEVGIGCVRIDHQTIQRRYDSALHWHETRWNQMDVALFAAMRDQFHIHTPPLAHLTPLKEPNVNAC